MSKDGPTLTRQLAVGYGSYTYAITWIPAKVCNLPKPLSIIGWNSLPN